MPYSPTFLEQVEKGNVERITPQGATVEGEFKKAVSCRHEARPRTSRPRSRRSPTPTRCPSARGARGRHLPSRSTRPALLSLLLGFGPVILLVGLFVCFARRAAGRPDGRARRVRALAGPPRRGRRAARHLQRRGRHRRGQVRAHRGRRLPQEPRALPAARRPHPARRPARGPPGTGKTLLARAVAGEAGRAVLLDLGVGVRRGDRRHRRLPRARPLQAGQGGRAGDHLHRRARRDRPLALQRRRLRRRQRRARADAQPDPDRDGRLRVRRRGDRARRHQPPGDPGRRAAAPGPLRPPRDRPAAGQGRPRARSSRSTRAPCRWPTTSTSAASPPTTPGMVGADLANLANEAALLAARRDHEKVQLADFTDALEKIVLGAPRGIVLSEEDRRRAAYHEAGHAIVGMLTPGADPVRKVSIIPRGMALGVTISAPDARPGQLRRGLPADARSTSRSAAASRRSSSTARSPPARSPTSSSSPGSRARWSAAGA